MVQNKKPGVSMPQWFLDEIEERREKGESRSEYIRDALKARFKREDDGSWTAPEYDGEIAEQPAD